MKSRYLTLKIFAVIFWIIGSIILYKEGGSNSIIITVGVIILIGFYSDYKKKKTI